MARTGRPSKLTPDVCEAIARNIEIGVTIEVAADAEGVGRSTALSWLQQGRAAQAKAEQGESLSESEAAAADFLDHITRARARFEIKTLERLQCFPDAKTASAEAKALTWLLERSRRERYGAEVTVKVSEAKEYMLDVVERVCARMGAPAVFEEVLAELARGGPSEAGEAPAVEPVH